MNLFPQNLNIEHSPKFDLSADIHGPCSRRSLVQKFQFHSDDMKQRIKLQSTLVISNLKGPSETFRDIRSSTYQMCKTEENTNRTSKFHK